MVLHLLALVRILRHALKLSFLLKRYSKIHFLYLCTIFCLTLSKISSYKRNATWMKWFSMSWTKLLISGFFGKQNFFSHRVVANNSMATKLFWWLDVSDNFWMLMTKMAKPSPLSRRQHRLSYLNREKLFSIALRSNLISTVPFSNRSIVLLVSIVLNICWISVERRLSICST